VIAFPGLRNVVAVTVILLPFTSCMKPNSTTLTAPLTLGLPPGFETKPTKTPVTKPATREQGFNSGASIGRQGEYICRPRVFRYSIGSFFSRGTAGFDRCFSEAATTAVARLQISSLLSSPLQGWAPVAGFGSILVDGWATPQSWAIRIVLPWLILILNCR
jgi:hypothetical protein